MPLTDARGRNRLTPSRIARAAVRRAALPANYARLAARSRLAGGPVVDPRSDVTVSLTTHGERLATVHREPFLLGSTALRVSGCREYPRFPSTTI